MTLPQDDPAYRLLTEANGDTRFVKKGDLFVYASDYLAVGDAVTDDTAALQATFDAAFAANRTAVLDGKSYKTTGTLNIKCSLEAGNATILYYGSSVALRIGTNTIDTSLQEYAPPSVEYRTSTTTWGVDTVGIEFVNLYTSKIRHTGKVKGFHYGYRFVGRGRGFVYNEIQLGMAENNRISYHLTQDETGWCNENNFYSGRTHVVPGSYGAIADDPDAYHMFIEKASNTIGGPNNNRFFGLSLEGSNTHYYRIRVSGGRHNAFYSCRFESSVGATARIKYDNSASSNIIHYGYDAWKLVIEENDTSSGNVIYDIVGSRAQAKSHSAQAIPSGVDTILTGWGTLGLSRATFDAGTGKFTPSKGDWLINATVAFNANTVGKRTAFLLVGEPGGATTRIAFDEKPASSTGITALKLSGRWLFKGTEQFWIVVNQTAGADQTLAGSTGNTTLYADRLNG